MPLRIPSARLFLALWPDDATRARLRRLQQDWTWPAGAALVDAGKLHLTLHFLGNVPLPRLDEFGSELAIEPGPPVALDLQDARASVWPGGIAVLAFEPTPALLQLHASLATALARLGWPREASRWRPHVTLARKAAGARLPATAMEPAEWNAGTAYALVHSAAGRYQVIRAYGRAGTRG